MEQHKRHAQNAVGPKIRKLRNQMGLSQEAFVAKCQIAGFDISRATLSKIEARIRCVTDKELRQLAKILKVKTDDLF